MPKLLNIIEHQPATNFDHITFYERGKKKRKKKLFLKLFYFVLLSFGNVSSSQITLYTANTIPHHYLQGHTHAYTEQMLEYFNNLYILSKASLTFIGLFLQTYNHNIYRRKFSFTHHQPSSHMLQFKF